MTGNQDSGNGRIVVINPNSSDAVTNAMNIALDPLRLDGGPHIDCVTMSEGPPGIETQEHVDDAVGRICELVKDEAVGVDAFVIACFSDPGLRSARELTDVPVFGIAESAFSMALNYGQSFGVIAILPASVTRQERYVTELGLVQRYAASQAVGLGVTELEGPSTGELLEATGRELVETKGADVLILGCAGMARHRESIERGLGVPVIDPAQAAVVQAIAAVRLRQTTVLAA